MGVPLVGSLNLAPAEPLGPLGRRRCLPAGNPRRISSPASGCSSMVELQLPKRATRVAQVTSLVVTRPFGQSSDKTSLI